MRQFTTLLFDLDGTLLNSIAPILDSFGHVFATYLPHKIYDPSIMVMELGRPLKQQMHELADGDLTLAEQMVQAYREHNIELMKRCELYPGTKETLEGLKARGYTLGIITSKGRKSAQMSVDQHGLSPLLDVFLCFEDTSKHKPEPEPLLEALRRLGADAKASVYLGDSTHDLHCAKAAQVAALAALWGPFAKESLLALEPLAAFHSIHEILAFVE